MVQKPSDPTITRFYAALLRALGAPTKARYQVPHLEQLVLMLMRRCGVRMLVIDELHNVFGGRGDRRREFLNLLRSSATSCGSRWSASRRWPATC